MWRFPSQGSNRSWSCQPTPEPKQCGIPALFAIYTTAHGNPGSLTHWASQGLNLQAHASQSDLFPLHPMGILTYGLKWRNMSHPRSNVNMLDFHLVSSCIWNDWGVPIMAQWFTIRLGTMRFWVRSLASISALRIGCCCELWCSSQTLLGSYVAVALA